MDELLTICDESGNLLYDTFRETAHTSGLLHRVIHCWVVSFQKDGWWIYFQQRALRKNTFPGLYDLAVGGHIGAGESPESAVRREMLEELGIDAAQQEFRYLGNVREVHLMEGFDDREIGLVYLYNHPNPVFRPGPEVEQVVRVSLAELKRKELEGSPITMVHNIDTGKKIELKAADWCHHSGEFERLVLPVLNQG